MAKEKAVSAGPLLAAEDLTPTTQMGFSALTTTKAAFQILQAHVQRGKGEAKPGHVLEQLIRFYAKADKGFADKITDDKLAEYLSADEKKPEEVKSKQPTSIAAAATGTGR